MLRWFAILTFATITFGAVPLVPSYAFMIKYAVVTPAFLKTHKVPFSVELAEPEGEMVAVTVLMEPFIPEFGRATECQLVVFDEPVPSETRFVAWYGKHAAKRTQIAVPDTEQKSVLRLLMVPLARLDRSALYFHYAKPDYGGDRYWVRLVDFLPAKKQTITQKPTSEGKPGAGP